MPSKILKDDLRFLIFSEIYLRFSEPKTRRKAFAIFESAISLFDKKGFEQVTLTMIAREAGATRQLLSHYFESLDEIRELTLKYIRVTGQKLVTRSVGDASRADLILRAYLEAHREWASNFRPHLRVWLGFLNSSARNKKDRQMNALAIEAGTSRIQELLELGKTQGVFASPETKTDSRQTARLIQTLMLGWLISTLTEDEGPALEALTENVLKQCLSLAGLKSL